MRKVLGILPPLAVGVALLTAAAPASAAPLSGGTWGNAQELPGIAALNKGGDALIHTLSCASAGNCVTGGYYADGSDHSQAFVAAEKDGTWGDAQEVPGTATLNAGGFASVDSVSCPSAGNCVAGGSYLDSSHHSQAFVAAEKDGTWGAAREVPGTAALNTGGDASVTSVSCASAGNCSAAGTYSTPSTNSQVFVVSETSGTWGAAAEMPGLGALNAGGNAVVGGVSCASAGNCAVGGDYTTASSQAQPYVANETSGAWGTAEQVPGSGTLNKGGNGETEAVSCASTGDCSAGGSYNSGRRGQAFTVDQTGGTWADAKEVPGSAKLNTGGYASVDSVSCASAGNCSAVGLYTDGSGNYQAFAVSEKKGTWGKAAEIPGTAELNTASAEAASVSCAPAGDCGATGTYSFSRAGGGGQAFVVSEAGGVWGNAEQVPGVSTLETGGNSGGAAVSCSSLGHCAAVGDYTAAGVTNPYVVSET